MISFEDAKKNYEKKYNNNRVSFDLNVNKNLKIDFKQHCQELSRKGKDISASQRICVLMVMDMGKNHKH